MSGARSAAACSVYLLIPLRLKRTRCLAEQQIALIVTYYAHNGEKVIVSSRQPPPRAGFDRSPRIAATQCSAPPQSPRRPPHAHYVAGSSKESSRFLPPLGHESRVRAQAGIDRAARLSGEEGLDRVQPGPAAPRREGQHRREHALRRALADRAKIHPRTSSRPVAASTSPAMQLLLLRAAERSTRGGLGQKGAKHS